MRKTRMLAVVVLALVCIIAGKPAYADKSRAYTLLGFSYAESINERGQVVGWNSVNGNAHPVLWTKDEGVRDLGILGGEYGYATAINNRGQVVGWSQYSLAEPDSYHVIMWTKQQGLIDLTPTGTFCLAYGINEAGKIVGECLEGGEAHPSHATLWTGSGGTIDLGTLPGGNYSRANDINNRGQVVGESWIEGNVFHAFIWTARQGMIDLGTSGGVASGAKAINDRGQIVGWSGEDGPYVTSHACIWTKADGMVRLDTLGGNWSIANDINDRGVVVGQSETAAHEFHAFAWIPQHGLIDLGPEGTESIATSINSRGEIVGAVRNAAGELQAALWELR